MRIPACFLLVLCLHSAHAASKPELRLKAGDDPRWAARDWDDRNWEKVGRDQMPSRAGVFWVRFRLVKPDPATWRPGGDAFMWQPTREGEPIDSFGSGMTCSYELYWDGRFIFRSGVVGGNRTSETPGPLENMAYIPAELLGSGEHVIALRLSSYHCNFPHQRRFALIVGMQNFNWRVSREDRTAIYPMIGMGSALVLAVLSATLFWFMDRRRPLFIASLLSLAVACYYLVVGWRWLSWMLWTPMTYDWLYPEIAAADALAGLSGGFLLWLLLEQFAVPRRVWWLAALGLLDGVGCWANAGHYSTTALWLVRAAMACSFLVAAWAAWKRRTGARFALAAAVIGLTLVRLDPATPSVLPPSFLITIGLFVLALLALIGLQAQATRRRARSAELTAARLKIELLKKNLQPHFLLNTLTALSEVIERRPTDAVRLIDDLAEEFRSLCRMSAEKLVPLEHELDLCRAHLRVMAQRTGRAWQLEAGNLDLAALVPPALFLTLIENGFAHQQVATSRATFALRQETTPGGATTYIFVSPGDPRTDSAHPPGGTGLRYVKARLEESFPGRWSFRQGPLTSGWETVIEVHPTAGMPCAS